MAEVKIKFEAKYQTHNVKSNKSIDVTFKMSYSELTQYLQTIQMLNENVLVASKIGADKPRKLGTFMISNLNVGGDGEGKLKINSQLDYVDGIAIQELAEKADEPLILLMKADIEDTGDDEEQEEEAEEETEEDE